MLKYLWASPATLLGLVVVGLTALTRGHVQTVSGTIEAWGGFSTWFFRHVVRRALVMTVGHVIIGTDEESVSRYRRHERVHVRQYEKWGPLFIPLYLAASVRAWMQGKHYYRDNVFELEAEGRSQKD